MPLASTAPLFAASIAPGPPPVMTANPASTSALPMATPAAYSGESGLRTGRAEHADGGREFGERAEALDELRLDAHDPPGVGVHPLGGTFGVEQALVGGARLDLVAATDHRAEPLLLGALPALGVAHVAAPSTAYVQQG